MDTPDVSSWLNLLTQGTRFITLDLDAADGLIVERCTGREAVNGDFQFTLDCLSASAFLDLPPLSGTLAHLGLATADGSRRSWHGYITRAASLGADGGLARYRLTLQSGLAFLQTHRNTLIFQDQTALDVVAKVLADYPQLPVRTQITATLRQRPICTQYRETDLAFVTRLLGEEGLSYRIEQQQGDSDDGPGCTLVIFDAAASQSLPAGEPASIRFHRIAATEATDAITRFAERREVVSNAVTTASWAEDQVQGIAGTAEAPTDADAPELPSLDLFEADRAQRFADAGQAAAFATHHLEAARMLARSFAGQGSVRTLEPGKTYTLTEHPDLAGQAFVPLIVEHLATNNLGTHLPQLLGRGDDEGLGRGSYRNAFLAIPAGVPIAPAHHDQPLAPSHATALVVGVAGEALTGTRNHQVRVQFFWQRGTSPNAGGLTATGSSHNPDGHAPGDQHTGTWVRVAETNAGAHHGASFVPRIGTEVLIEYAHGDLDQPLVVGQLYNGHATPVFAAGEHSSANHPGTLSGIQTQTLDGGPSASWVLDDASGQLRHSVSHAIAASHLDAGYLIGQADSQRGGYLGEGFALASAAWTMIRAGAGMLVSGTARPQGQSTQMDAAESIAQLRGAAQTARRLDSAASQATATRLHANSAQTDLQQPLDPMQQGKYPGTVNGQAATKPNGASRSGDAPVEYFAQPVLLMESPTRIAWTSPKDVAAFAGEHLHVTSQRDAHLASGATIAIASGDSAGLYAADGGMQVIANHGPVTIAAHTDQMQVLADQDVTVTSTADAISVLAKHKIVLAAGQSSITLDGQNLTLACPGTFTVKTAQHQWLGGDSQAAAPAPLPSKLVDLPTTNDKTPTLSKQPCACAIPAHKQDNYTESRDCANYYETNAKGLAVLNPRTGGPIKLDYASGSGTFDLAYDPKDTTLTATLKIKVVPKEWQKLGPDGKIVKGKDGEPVLLPYNASLAMGGNGTQRPHYQEVNAKDAHLGMDKMKPYIEGILNQHHYHLTQKACQKGGSCKCQVPIKLKVEFVTSGHAHVTVNMFPTAIRADSDNWAVTQVVMDAKTNKYTPIGNNIAQVHEAGHLFAWPDEYFLDGGAIYNKYINAKKLVDVKMADLTNDWQRETDTNLMGRGMWLQATPNVPKHYFHKIRDWFQSKAGGEWHIEP